MEILEYNQLTNHTLDSQSGSTGLGTIGATLSGKDIVVTYSPIAGVTTTFVNVLAVGFSSGLSWSWNWCICLTKLSAEGVDIASSGSPTATMLVDMVIPQTPMLMLHMESLLSLIKQIIFMKCLNSPLLMMTQIYL